MPRTGTTALAMRPQELCGWARCPPPPPGLAGYPPARGSVPPRSRTLTELFRRRSCVEDKPVPLSRGSKNASGFVQAEHSDLHSYSHPL